MKNTEKLERVLLAVILSGACTVIWAMLYTNSPDVQGVGYLVGILFPTPMAILGVFISWRLRDQQDKREALIKRLRGEK